MNKGRELAEKQILEDLNTILPGCCDVELYRAYFSKMSDKEFDAFIQRLKSKEEWLTITVPNGGNVKGSIEHNIAIGKKWGHSFFQRLYMPPEGNNPGYLTPNEYFVIKPPIRVASQRLAKKMSIPKNQRSINALTGQVTGESKGAGFSYPELRLCVAMGLNHTATELMKYRGGDVRGWAAMSASLARHGAARQDQLAHFASGVISTSTVKSYLTSAHLKNTL